MENGLFFDIAKNDFPRFVNYEDENDKLNLRGVILQIGTGRRSWFFRWITRLRNYKIFCFFDLFSPLSFHTIFYVLIIPLHIHFLLLVEYKTGIFY